jgi:hypothetical protein
VSIEATSGALRIEAGPEGQVSVEDSIEVRSATRGLARSALATFQESGLTSTAGGASITIRAPERFNRLAFDLRHQVTVRMPADAALRLRGQAVAADIQGLAGPLDLSVDSGAIRLQKILVNGADRITATAGAVDFEGSLAEGSLDVETDSGAIRLSLPRDTNATYDVATSSGAILIQQGSTFPVLAAGTQRSLTGVLGSGGGTAIKLRANSGAISVRAG